MYLQHFGLKQRLFRADIDASSIFVGPQNTAAMAAVRKALATDDAAIIVSGPVGVGKTALVEGLALKIFAKEVPVQLKDLAIFSLEMGSVVAGTRANDQLERCAARAGLGGRRLRQRQ